MADREYLTSMIQRAVGGTSRYWAGLIADHLIAHDVQPVVHGRWEWFEEWLPSTTEHPRECEDCGWRCGNCKRALEDMVGGYWDIFDEKPQLTYCPNCGCRMDMDVQ